MHADVIVCDRLAPLAVLEQARPDAVIIDVAKIPRGDFTPQERINELLVEHARAGSDRGPAQGRRQLRLRPRRRGVAGLCGRRHPGTVVPGVSSAIAGPALAGIPLTHRAAHPGLHRDLRSRRARRPAPPSTGRRSPAPTRRW